MTTKSINQFSLKMLVGMLAQSGWYPDIAHMYRAGKLLDDVLPEYAKEPGVHEGSTPEQIQAQKDWATKTFDLELTAKQLDTISVCVKHFVNSKQLQSSRYIISLLDLAGLKPED